jgi:hypothetical protein
MEDRRRDSGRKPAASVRMMLAPCAALCLAAAPALVAQAGQGTAEARAEYERGREAAKQKLTDAAIAAFRRAIELDPRFFDAHERFVSATHTERAVGLEIEALLPAAARARAREKVPAPVTGKRGETGLAPLPE